MKLPISAVDRIEFTPDHYYPEGGVGAAPDHAPIYIVKPLTVRDRAAITREVTIQAGKFPTMEDRLQHMDDHLDGVVGKGIDQAREAIADALAVKQANWGDDLALEINALHDAFMMADQAYRQLVAAANHYGEVQVLTTASRGLLGWINITDPDGRSAELPIKNGFADQDLVALLPGNDLLAIFNKIMELSSIGKDEEKNFASPPGSGGGQKTSKAASAPRTGAKAGSAPSRKKSTRKTRATA